MTVTDRKRPWRLVQILGPDERNVYGYFESRKNAEAVMHRETDGVIWSSVEWYLEHWNGSKWVPVEEELPE